MGLTIDLNSDLGESFGAWQLGDDAAVLAHISSANIACGLHAGDPLVMARTVRLAKAAGVAVGAHPGYPDLQGFGRRALALTPAEVEAFVLYQIGALAAVARAQGVTLTHVKPHGALYNQAAQDRVLAQAVARAVAGFSRSLIVVGLAGSQLIVAAEEAGLRAASEGFPDRGYQPDGTLTPRSEPGALLADVSAVATHAVRLATEGIQVHVSGQTRSWPVQTLCLHGDQPEAAASAQAVRAALAGHQITIKSLAV